ncbi:hypothetical protein Cob_v004438 [Colletotrichum orbiculare MAFF 240422]|uniref:Uncharacterized protein n=1 Tax=Colletotrichum orbiculare (strain 104-T / ATCC 96160 / CBS 514.97 / LARS 414 / MAFF 240422) TaxID=1213857 RepID=A0A484G0H7_COLOR|nr:hypothetical protein Cob_v004438 [Colletotrichum orbiculare MAFF 240422]
MSRDLEQLIESLITDISCYGDLGCTVTHILDALCGLYQKSAIQLDCCVDPVQIDTSSRLLWSTAWDWLKERKDISVGANRKWNHLPLAAILAIPDTDVQADAANPLPVVQLSSSPAPLVRVRSPVEPAQHPLRINSPRKRPRVYVSEDRMWEAIAGHAPDYRRIPRLEWMALVGIASTKEGGILQGDLGRLVGQDKRSLPKRTDALAEKGYISKRTTLVRGTKTSKMWLTHFAPALPTDPTKAAAGMLTTVDMSRDALARDLDPVPWRARWTGDSVDYISLAETIMAVVKAFGIIRYHDLRWAIQYVGATLAGKLFKDCLKFAHDLTHEDWAAYLATGKQKNSAVLPSGCADLGVHASHSFTSSASIDNATSLGLAADPSCHTNRERLSAQLFWVVDKPLILTVFDKIAAASDLGLSNKQIGGSTLGSSFRRYLSSISSTLAIPTLQPEHLSHFRVGSEMHRKGKSQQYRYFARHLNKCVDFTVPSAEGIVTTRPWQGGDVARQLRVSQRLLVSAPLCVRDMPSEHAIVQSVLQRPRLDESPRQLCLDRREQSLTGKSGFAQLSAIADRRSLSDYANQTPAQHTSIESGISSSKVAGIAPTEGEAVRTMLGSNNLPQSLAEMIKWRGQPRTTFPRSDQYLEFCEQADACFDWELSGEGIKLMLAESIAPEYIFIDLGVDDLPGEWDSPPLEWSPTNQLSPVEWLSLRTSDPSIAADHLWSGDPSRQRRKKQRQKHIRNNEKDVVVSLDLKTRSLITLPKDADFKDGARRANGLDETNETLLIAAFVATRTLLGGADRIIEWGLMMTLFPNMALSAMRRFWSKARKDRKSFIDQLTERFQVRFVASYEREEFPAIDFDNYVNYDWSRVIKWTASLIEDSFELPVSKSALGQGYSLTAAWADVDHWREDYYNFQMSVFNRFEAATSRPATKDLDQRRKVVSNPTADDITTAMSWLRSLCYTPRDKYAPQDIRLKMSSLGGGDENRIHGLLEQAVETLQGQGVITDSKLKALEGRPYRLTETFLPRFVKWTHESKFIDAARFKSKLDGSFRRGEKIRIPYVLKDGEVMAMMNLQASGRIAVVAVDVPHIPLGFDPGNYESRKYPKSYYNFGLEIAPTKDYVYDEDLDILQQASSNSPPKENHNRAIPLWSDFFGALNKERWSQVLGAIAFIVSTRGPLDAASVCAVLKPGTCEKQPGSRSYYHNSATLAQTEYGFE